MSVPDVIRVLIALAVVALPAAAQEAPLKNATVRGLVAELTPPPLPEGARVRGIVRGLEVEPDPGPPPSVDLAVEFEFDSARLTGEAKELLATLAGALKSKELWDYRFALNGHTDATGTPDYNLTLSRERAYAVREHLIVVHGITADRLQAMGLGETSLLFPNLPDDARNRRVEVLTLN